MTIKRFGDATMIADMVVHNGIAYLAGQVYLEPHPRELMLRNHV